METITTPKQAVQYAQSSAYKPTCVYPRIIHLQGTTPVDGLPQQLAHDYDAVIIVRKKVGDCTPTPHDLQTASDCHKVLAGQGIQFLDNIIVGDNGIYSFAEERVYPLD